MGFGVKGGPATAKALILLHLYQIQYLPQQRGERRRNRRRFLCLFVRLITDKKAAGEFPETRWRRGGCAKKKKMEENVYDLLSEP